MKRGFMNTPRAKRVIEEAYAPRSPPGPDPPRQLKPSSSAPSRHTQDGDSTAVRVTTSAKAERHPEGNDPKGKGKAKAVDMDTEGNGKEREVNMGGHDLLAAPVPPRPSPGRPGWGRDPKEDFFHRVPPSLGELERKRAVFLFWPRDPKGKSLLSTNKVRGTLSPDGYPWGETLYDFYYVNRVPEIHNAVSTVTGSMMCEIMKELGELDAAAPQIEFSQSEGKPRVVGVANTEELIKRIDMGAHMFSSCSMKEAKISNQDEEQDGEDEQASGHDDRARKGIVIVNDGVEPIPIPPPPTIPVTSPFHPSHYPKPWPFVPFEGPPSVLLQERIPLYLLPQTLYVHDPFCLLHARERTPPDTSWTSRPDIVRTYNLKLSESVHKEVEEVRLKAEELEEFKARTLMILRYKRTKEQIKNYEPIIEVPLPPYLRRITKIEESHLYLSPVAKVGEGHHSIVYKGEWELPREMFTKTTICPLCFKESVDKEVQRLKDTGRWQKLMEACAWGPKGFTGRQPTQAELDEVNNQPNLAKDGEIIEREITCFVPPDIAPAQIVDFLEEGDVWTTLMKESANAMHLKFTQDDESERDSYAAVIRINPPFSYENQRGCTHTKNLAAPRTAKFTVVAKLSLEHDLHLAREASNYQEFPEHFFHHYNGYTIISQLHTIVPVNAVVPQFYGYYVPKEDKEQNPGQPSYLSPILLLEHCGTPIDPEELSDEDQEECASLLLRFQRAGWLHESVAPRNFLAQPGKPTEFPLMKECNSELSFRLIDFGRSRMYNTAKEKRDEELDVLRMCRNLAGKMGITL